MIDEQAKTASRKAMKLGYTVQLWREGGQYIAHAMPLDVASSGATPTGARAALAEAVNLFLKTAQEEGTLERILEETGYTREARSHFLSSSLKTSSGSLHACASLSSQTLSQASRSVSSGDSIVTVT